DRVLLNMIDEEINQGVFQMADEKTLDKIREVVASEKVYPAIYIIKAFIGLQGKKPSLDKARRLLKRINGGIQAKRIDPKFKKDINRIKGVLEKYVDERTATVDIDQQTLNGLNCACEGYDDIKIGDLGIEESEDLNNTYTVKKKSNPSDLSNPAFVNQMEIYPTPVNRTSFNQVSPTYTNGSRSVNNGSYLPSNVTSGASTLDGFTSSNQLAPSGNVERFEGPMGIFIGDMESNEYAICLKGDQGGGKSQLAFQLADEFLSMGKTVGFLSLEMAPNSHKVINYRDKYIKPENQSRFSISGKADDGIMSVRRAAEQFDVIVLDSWQGLDENSKEFGKLRKDFPSTKFVVIFQSTSGNTVRGGTRPLFDCDVVIHVHKHENGFEHNYAICEKNRMHTEGIRYIVASRSVNEGSVVPMLKTFN
ncbi:MAG: hypothetical protein ACPGTP_10055, partial [Bacteroidia bacterium]